MESSQRINLDQNIIVIPPVEINISSATINDEAHLIVGATVEVQGYENSNGFFAEEIDISE